jgi:ectoine hydroxylase-related dioxygenase (phytanoyl-CoA dioxygenase family)
MESSILKPTPTWRTILRRLKARWPALARLVRYIITWATLLRGALVNARMGVTPKSAHHALVELFMMSGGRANDLMARAMQIMHPPYDLPQPTGVLGKLTDRDLERIQMQLERDGYFVFENCLAEEFCESMIQQSLELDCEVMGDEAAALPTKTFSRYSRKAPIASLYSLTRDDTTDIREVQQLISDPSLIKVAQNYLKSKPIFTGIYMGWSAAVKDTPDSEAAQEFHWDMERIKWIRYFFYLTDVTPDTGPHCFIAGTHRAGAIPRKLRELGYVRHQDETILKIYGKDAYREFTGPRGTIIAEDSRGFHKGKMPNKGDRLLLAFELSNSTFGVNKRHLIRNIRFPQFGEFAKKHPHLYSNFDFSEGLLN